TSYTLARLGRRMLAGKYRVGCWVWEFASLPERWAAHAQRFHLLAAPNAFVANAIGQSVADRGVVTLPYPLDPDNVRSEQRPLRDPARFRVGFIFDASNDTGRKNPEAVIEAVARAFPNDPQVDVIFTVATGGAGHPRVERLVELARSRGVNLAIDLEARTRSDHLQRFADLDAYVSLHRAEGFALTVAEAVQSGVPVVSTRAAPLTEYLNETNSYLVDAKAVRAPALLDTSSPGLWHEADVDDAARQLRRLRQDPVEARLRARQAQVDVMQHYGPDAFQAGVVRLLERCSAK
ncbi:MAG: glycosyltransferase family 4 protein, partial [Beijerinckiaceae bacterium]